MRYPHDQITGETLLELEEVHKKYELKPLRRKQIIEWNGPPLYPECAVDIAEFPNARRKPLEALLSTPSPCRPGPGGPGWQLELLSPVAVGDYAIRNSQIWSCKVRRASEEVGEVIVKFYFKGWFGYKYIVDQEAASWFVDQDGIAKTEARAYERFKPIQGSQVPFCYGIFDFKLPGKFEVKGMVLEDLTDTMESVLSNFNETEISEAGVRPYSKWIDTLLRGVFLNLHTIHDQKIMVSQTMFAKDIFIPRNSLMSHSELPHVSFVGFAYSQAFEDWHLPREGDLGVREPDCDDVIETLGDTFTDGIAHRWQYHMRDNGLQISTEFEVLYDVGRLLHWNKPLEGEFMDDSDSG